MQMTVAEASNAGKDFGQHGLGGCFGGIDLLRYASDFRCVGARRGVVVEPIGARALSDDVPISSHFASWGGVLGSLWTPRS